jgi:hypothetical protein
MTRTRWTLLVVGLLAPVVAVVVLLIAVVGDVARLGAAIALAVLLVALGAAVVAVAWGLRRYRRIRTVLDGESIALDEPSLRVRSGDPTVAAWPVAARIRAGRALGLSAGDIAGFGMATRSPFALEQLAGLATAWRLGPAELADLFTATDEPTALRLALGRVETSTLLLFARTFASQFPGDPTLPDAIARYVARTPGVDGLPLSVRHWLLERLVVAGDLERAAVLLGQPTTTHGQLIAIDTLNPFIPGARLETPVAWRAALTGLFARAGLEGVELAEGAGAPLDRLRAAAAAGPGSDGPLVSIIMTTYRPEADALATAIGSVLHQSWSEWELLLIDDGSPAEFDATLATAAARDPRIRLIRAERNTGTYVRRNEALLAAKGRYVTLQDADDWMHPRRIEAQVRHLAARPDLLANVCRSARVTPEMRFVQPRGTLLRLTESSILFRRDETIERVGFFDSVRKGADTGFRLRIEAVTGRPVPIVDVEAPLILSRFDDRSLSGADLRDGWTHPARVAYSSAHAAWVAAERSAGRAPRIGFPLAERPFPAPAELLGDLADPVELDVVFVADLRADPHRAARHRLDAADIRAAVDAGLRVGVRRLDAPTRGGVPPATRSSVQALINDGRVTELLPSRDARARLVVVLEEPALLGAPPETDGLASGTVLVVGPATPLSDECRAAAVRLVPGADPIVVSRSEARRAVVQPDR